MKKIFFIRANKTKLGGAEVYLSRLVNALSEQKIDCEVINSKLPKFLPSWVRVMIFNIQVCLFKKDKFYFSLERISCPDIYRAGDGVHKVFLSVEKKSKLNPLHMVYLFLEKQCFLKAKKIIANSEMIKEQIIGTYNINEQNIEVIYNGVKTEKVDKAQAFEMLAQEFKIEKNDQFILYVGSGFKRKGVASFLQILAKLKNRKFKAFVVGKEKKLNHYKELAVSLGLSGRVFFTGGRNDVNFFYSISDVFILPTRYEPFSNVVLEAMSYKTAVFTTQQNGAAEILDKNYVMNSCNDFAVVDLIDQLLESKQMLSEVKEKNYQKAGELSMDLNVKKTLQVVVGVIDQAKNLR